MKIDLTGKKYERLTAIEPTNKRTKQQSVIWLCQCDCGNTTFVSTTNFGQTKSCGCLKIEKAAKYALQTHEKAYSKLKSGFIEGTSLYAHNQKKSKNNHSGVKGVHYDKKRRKWVAQITFRRKSYFLGRFDKMEEAVQARKQAEKEYFEKFRNDLKG